MEKSDKARKSKLPGAKETKIRRSETATPDLGEIQTLKDRIAQLENQRKQDKEEYDWDLKAARESKENEIRKLMEEIEFLRKKQDIESQEGGKDQEVVQLKGELAQMKIASGQMMEQLDRETERVKSDLEEARKIQQKSKAESETLRREMARLRDELSVTKTERDELVGRINALKQHMAATSKHASSVPASEDPLEDDFLESTLNREVEVGIFSNHKKDDRGVKIARFAKGYTIPGEVPPSPGQAMDSVGREAGSTDFDVLDPPSEFDQAETQKLDDLMHQPDIVTEIVTTQALVDQKQMSFSSLPGWLKIAGAVGFFGVILGLVVGVASRDDTSMPEAVPDASVASKITTPGDEPSRVDPKEESTQPTEIPVPSETPEAVEEKQQSPRLEGAAEAVQKAQALIRRNRTQQAVKLLGHWVKKKSQDAQLHFLFGVALYKSHRMKSAAAQFEKASEIDPNMSKAYYRLGYIYIEMKQKKKACRALKSFLRLEPDSRLASRVKNELRKQRCL